LSDDDRDAPFVSVHWRSILPRWLTLTPAALVTLLVVFVVAVVIGTLSLELVATPMEGELRVQGRSGRAKRQPSPARQPNPRQTSSTAEPARVSLPAVAESAITSPAGSTGEPTGEPGLRRRPPAPHAIARLTSLAPERLQNWREELVRLPWPTSELSGLLTVDLAHLDLSVAQQERIAEIVRSAVARLRQLAASQRDLERQAEQADQLQREAAAQITSLFSSRQLAQWRSLTAQTARQPVR
ncbi:MAG: hypothetical protein JNG90_04610, partial [Planctomycetaceae bacterium]|nr:hypothetical protein [Planctomycetaceae bacterium]